MRRSTLVTTVALAGTLVCGSAALAQGAKPRLRTVYTEQEAVVLGIPELVSSGMVASADWSDSGRHVLAVREYFRIEAVLARPQPPEIALVLYNSTTRKAQDLLKRPAATGAQVAWLPKTDTALVVMDQWSAVPQPGPNGEPPQPDRWLYRIDARGKGSVKAVGRLAPDTMLAVSPTQAVAALWSMADHSLRILGEDAAVRHTVRSPENGPSFAPSWSPDGSFVIDAILEEREGKQTVVWRRIDVRTGRITVTDKQPPIPAPKEREVVAKVRLKHARGAVNDDKTTEAVHPLWLESPVLSDDQRTLIVADAEWGRVSPRGDAVLYVTEGAAWVAPLSFLPKEPIIAARNAAKRQVLMSNGKQIAVALLMYAQDNDERLPGAGEPIMELTQPYSKNESLYQGLVYVFPGGPMADIEAPAETILGYIPGPGGRANIFADGHVKWEPE